MSGLPQGPPIGTVLTLEQARVPVRVVEVLGQGGQGMVYRVTVPSGASLALKWYRPGTDTPEQRRAVLRLIRSGQPHPAFLWPVDHVVGPRGWGFGYVMPVLETRFVSVAQLLNDPVAPAFGIKAEIARNLADAIGALHTNGLCYRDINFANLYADPGCGAVAFIDNDNVGLDAGHVSVRGTLQFMAPEVLRNEALPSTVTDLHSLAVLIFFLFMHGHPLDGVRVAASQTWDAARHVGEAELLEHHYGRQPLFVFDPLDDSNHPPEGDRRLVWWSVYPGFVKDLFTKAFTTGLRDASLHGRVTSGAWSRASIALADLTFRCDHCPAALVLDPQDPHRTCWQCGNVPRLPPQLVLPGHHLALSVGTPVFAGHVRSTRGDFDTVAARVEAHPTAEGRLVLRNLSPTPWTVRPAGEGAKQVAVGQAFAVRPASVDFGRAVGQIRTDAMKPSEATVPVDG